jgi:hypothetical protein
MAYKASTAEALVVSVPDAAVMLGVSLRHAWSLVKTGQLAHIRNGQRVGIEVSEIRAFLDRHRSTEHVPHRKETIPA